MRLAAWLGVAVAIVVVAMGASAIILSAHAQTAQDYADCQVEAESVSGARVSSQTPGAGSGSVSGRGEPAVSHPGSEDRESLKAAVYDAV
jgi:hypothetical protein